MFPKQGQQRPRPWGAQRVTEPSSIADGGRHAHLCVHIHMGRMHCDVRVAVVPPDDTCEHATLLGEALRLSRAARHLLWTRLDSVLRSPPSLRYYVQLL